MTTIVIKHCRGYGDRIGGANLTIDGQEVRLVTDAGLKWDEKTRRFHFFYKHHRTDGPPQEETVVIEDFYLTVE